MTLEDRQLEFFKSYVGKNVYIQTITLYFTGRLTAVDAGFFEIEEAAWIAQTGRVANALVEGPESMGEVEPYPASLPVRVSIAATVVFFEWRHDLPREQVPKAKN